MRENTKTKAPLCPLCLDDVRISCKCRCHGIDTKKKSFTESVFDVFLGFVIYLPINFFILPLFAEGIMDYSISTMLAVSSIYTSIAIVRKYVVRRWFIRL